MTERLPDEPDHLEPVDESDPLETSMLRFTVRAFLGLLVAVAVVGAVVLAIMALSR